MRDSVELLKGEAFKAKRACENKIVVVCLERQMTERYSDQEFVEHVIKAIVTHPEDVVVERKVDEMGVLLTLKVNPSDMGLVIGKRGSTARAIRTLARIIGLRNHARVNFKIAEPEGSTRIRKDEMESVVEELKS